MKCRSCRAPAVIDVRRHNAAFCSACFIRHCQEQVSRAIDSHKMLGREDRALALVCPHGPVRRVFELAGVSDVFALYPPRAAAAAALVPVR